MTLSWVGLTGSDSKPFKIGHDEVSLKETLEPDSSLGDSSNRRGPAQLINGGSSTRREQTSRGHRSGREGGGGAAQI
ncbi:hypothetical protein NL676_014301 [Syzygium grande]|nr:hypothetical protein NL676_014301 [Syzygium grande]